MTGTQSGYLAVDIGGSKLAVGVVGVDGTVLLRDRVATPQRNVWAALERLILRVRAAAPGVELIACGVGCAGPMAVHEGLVSPLPIAEWTNFPLRRRLEEFTGLMTVLDSDAKAMALGEGWCGAAVGRRDYMVVVVSNSVGGGIVSGGRLLSGRLGNAGQIGHVVVVADGRPCTCGGRGCLEAYVSGRAITADTGRPPEASIPKSVVERTGMLVGRAIATVMVTVDVRQALIGGSVAAAFGDVFFRSAQEELDRRLKLSFVRGARIDPAGLAASGPLIGAAALARQVSLGPNATLTV